MKFLSQVIASGSGSVGGCTYSRNRYGAYIRNRSVPVNPNTSQQQAVRSIFANLNTAWNIDLDQAERDAWDAYAAAVPRTDSLGQTTFVTGQNWFVACNTPRLQNGIARVDAAPTTLNLTELSVLPAPLVTEPDDVDVSFTNTDEWAGATGGYLFLYGSRGMNATRNFFKGPFRNFSFVPGAGTPPTSPATKTMPFALTAGQKVYLRAIAQAADGRLSVPQIVSAIVTS